MRFFLFVDGLPIKVIEGGYAMIALGTPGFTA
jgi:hypothetical protein